MKKIDKLVLGKFIGPLILTFFIVLFIFVMQFLWKYIDDLVGKGLEWYIVAELIFFASASFVPLALPLAVLLSSIMTLGDFGENYELVAAKSSGVSLLRFMRALIVAVCFITIGAFFFANNAVPLANLKFRTLLSDIVHKKPALNIKEGVFYNDIKGYSIRVGRKEPDNRTVHDVMVYDHTSGRGNDNVLIAKSGEMFTTGNGRYMVLKLNEGSQYSEMKPETKVNNYEHLKTEFKSWVKYFDLTQLGLQRSDESFLRKHYEMLNLLQLQKEMDTLSMEMEDRKEAFALSLAQYFSFKKFKSDSVLTQSNIVPDTTLISDFRALTSNAKLDVLKRAQNSAKIVKSMAGNIEREVLQKKKTRIRHELAWHRKLTYSLACLVLLFIGAPLGAIIRIGGLGMPMVVSVLFFVVFHVLNVTGQKVAEEGAISPFWGSWAATIVLLPLGIFLTYKAMRESSLLSLDWYYSMRKRFIQNQIQ